MHATELVLKGLHLSTEIQISLEHAYYSFLDLTEQVDPRRIIEEYDIQKVTLAF